MKLLDDTSPEARRVLADCFRSMSPVRKFAIIEDANRTSRQLHEAGFRLRHPDAKSEEVARDWRRLVFGSPSCPTADSPMKPAITESLQVVREVSGVFRRMGIAHALGGSMASSIHGEPRQTYDADITAEPFPGRESEFASYFGSGYYVDAESIRSAIRHRSSFNILQMHLGFKVDVFIQKDRAFERFAMQRRIEKPLSESPGDVIAVLTPEDILLHKLEWFRLGGEVSDRQWSDILGVLRVQAGRLDDEYLDYWANDLKVADLLREARSQV